MSISETKTQPKSSSKPKLNIIIPESPEVETTFVFNIGTKNKKQKDVAQVCESQIEKQKQTKEDDFKEDSLDVDASIICSLAGNVSSSTSNSYTMQLDEAVSSQNVETKLSGLACLGVSHEKLKRNGVESVVELTYPLKPYFSEDIKDAQQRRASNYNSKASSGSDSESNNAQKLKHSDDSERSGYENEREPTATRKNKRNRLSSGLLERRRSRTSSKDENTDDEDEGNRVFEPSTNKKSVSYETRYKKQPKCKYKSNDYAGKNGDKEGCEGSLNTNTSIFPVEHAVDEGVGSIKPMSSPKCTSKRIKKGSKPTTDDNSRNGNSCISYKFCCKGQTDEVVLNQGMTVNVFVPTTRKIFSPVRKDSRDETSTVISYVVEEPDPSSVSIYEPSCSSICGAVLKKTDNIEGSTTYKEICNEEYKELDSNKNQFDEKKDESIPKFDFVMPPCWIIKQARAQSASPALQRKIVTKPITKDTILEKEVAHNIADGQHEKFDMLKPQNGDESKEDCSNSTPYVTVSELESRYFDKQQSTDMFTSKDNCKKNSSSSESVENSRLMRKDGMSIPSSLKLRSEAGFPPISPLSVRREMKVMKETAPSIRMMIAKYNQRVHENQELSGTKSPDSGAQSPIAWRSPVTERRINTQMEKYQEEVRRAFQNNCKKEFYPNAKLGQVQKSASAGYIRPFEKGCSNDSINSKGEDKSFEQPLKCHGILKSSSAGAIKTVSPLPIKRKETNSSDINVCVVTPSPASNIRKEIKPMSFEIRSGENLSQAIRVNVSSVIPDCKRATTVDINAVPQIPTIRDDYNAVYLEQKHTSSIKNRAMKIKKAKEEFLLRGCVGEKSVADRTGTPNCPSTPETPIHNERLLWEGSKTRLSQISCDSESSYENVPMILVSGKELPRDSEGVLLVKSASVGMINMDSTACSTLFCGTSNSSEHSNQGAIPKSKSGILSRFRRARLKKNKEKEPKLQTVSTLCMQSLVVDINKNKQASSESIPSTSKSCPSSPVLHKKDQSATSWIINPRRIFKPKQ